MFSARILSAAFSAVARSSSSRLLSTLSSNGSTAGMFTRCQFWPLNPGAVGMFFEQRMVQLLGVERRRHLRVSATWKSPFGSWLAEEVARLLVADRELEAGFLQLLLQDLLGELTALVAGGRLEHRGELLAALGPDAVGALGPAAPTSSAR